MENIYKTLRAHKMSMIQLIDFPDFGNMKGELVVIEGDSRIPFDIKRVYYMYNISKEESRGFHAHKDLLQIAICITGSCTMLLDDGLNKENQILNSPKQGLLIDKMIWHEMHNFSDDCVLLILAADFYDESDYIRNYDDFIKMVKK